jgi:diacylglycerol kinase (ATP)
MERNKGIYRLFMAFVYSFAGFKAAWRNEAAFRQESIATICMIPLGLWLGETGTQRALLIGVWLLVIITELTNSAIEAIVDRTGQEYNELSGRAKDLGSAAVLVSLIVCVIVWGLIAVDKILS